jgi:hypothetical protein
MSRLLKVMLIICVATASAAAAPPKKNPDVEQSVKSELVGKMFTTKILVGSYIPCQNSSILHVARSDAYKMVDTELSPDGSIKFYARANCFYPGGMMFDTTKGYVAARFSSEIPPGTSVWVRGVDFKEDRIEVDLSSNNSTAAEGSGKIKYMLGTSYRTLSEDELMEAINHGIRIPAYEKLDQLKTEFETLRVNLQDLESRYNAPGGTAASRLANTIALMQILENIQKNRTEFTALGKSDPQALSYSEKLNALGPEITRLTEEARKERVSQVRDQLQAQIQELSAIQTQVRQKPPSSMGEWQQRSDDLDKYSTLLDERQKLLDKLQNEKEAPSPDDVKNMSESRAEIQTTRASLQNEHQQIELALQNEHQQAELADLTTQYRDLTEKRKQMLNAYLLAFGTAKEKVAKQNLIAVLDQMVANRDRAAALGDKTAATQLTQFRAEAEKYKNK